MGATVAVVGCGGIGLAAIQGAKLAGASRIIAVDLDAAKLEVATAFGATDVVAPGTDAVVRVHEIVPGGVDYAFEAVGRQATAELALRLLAPGGTATILGMVPDDTPIRVPASLLYFEEKTLTGAFIGSSRYPTDIPALTDLYLQGRLMLDEMISHRVPFSKLNEAMDTLAGGQALRIVIRMSEEDEL